VNRRTQTVPNHDHGKRDVKWGWDAVGALVAILALLSGILFDRISIEHRLSTPPVQTEEQRAALVNAVKAAIAESDRLNDWATRRELREALGDVEHELADTNVKVGAALSRLNSIDERQRHALGMIEKLPGAREDDNQ
jgi:hypothetical protein